MTSDQPRHYVIEDAAMQDLIERLERAAGPDRGLDGAISWAIKLKEPGDHAGWPPHYTASIDAALTLVPDGWAWSIRQGGCYPNGLPVKPRAELAEPVQTKFGPGVGVRAQIEAATPAIALCIAALKARQ